MFDRESYRQKLKEYKMKARKDIRKMCHLEFKKTCDELLSTAHQLMQDYVDFGEVLSSTFEQLSLRDRADDDDGDNDEGNVGLKDVVESLHSTFQSNFVKLMEPLGDIKKMGQEYRGLLTARLDEIKEGYRSLLQVQEQGAPTVENFQGTIVN